MPQEETQLRLLRLLQDEPELSQRELSRRIGVSVGSTNYFLRALIEKGWVKTQNFANNPQKGRYIYQLTPHGISEKARITRQFLARKRSEYEQLRAEIAALEREVEQE